ncbi:rhodanese-related sulfurtransferase [Synechococcus sp. CC9605]|uniref:tRNA uridine(34) hydroxylase n=1 Tax=Synechococcus sp. (strain CC9605) TaxID=110662 RepID=TRHO_SYNSC|nr:rhodanese-related sulfurtransferase [Synechococcus sp. CC9605]Q3AJ48.1 RecName: Full=tRNA uridine(34) hydroxylase; AltName: Full=tRNA hydroxylation protein O [Synechococcus sp. CC9605]ABB35384.1 Rhodanese-like [Synechococcus sp. CC9605]
MNPSNLEPGLANDSRLLVAAFYAFTPLDDERRETLLSSLPTLARNGSVLGSVLVAHEGVNGTISGPESAVDAVLDHLRTSFDLGDEHYARLEVKRSWAEKPVFRRFKARRKKEIVTIGVASVDPSTSVGTYVEAEHWNALVDDPDTLVIDTRNSYETAIGTFEGAIDPSTESFRDFPQWAESTLRPLIEQKSSKRIAMFCTGGIRCEKASSYLQQQGFGEVHHLRGGILKYLEQVPEAESRWQGECFVFDQRVALNHQLEPGEHSLCHACGLPVSAQQRELPSYIKGVQCLHCVDRFSDADRERFAMRQRQIDQRQIEQHKINRQQG